MVLPRFLIVSLGLLIVLSACAQELSASSTAKVATLAGGTCPPCDNLRRGAWGAQWADVRSYGAHAAVDICQGEENEPLRAMLGGQVIRITGINSSCGLGVILQAGEIEQLYCHFNAIESYVRVGAVIDTGMVLGTVGRTGNVTGPHLHYRALRNGVPDFALTTTMLADAREENCRPRQRTRPVEVRLSATKGGFELDVDGLLRANWNDSQETLVAFAKSSSTAGPSIVPAQVSTTSSVLVAELAPEQDASGAEITPTGHFALARAGAETIAYCRSTNRRAELHCGILNPPEQWVCSDLAINGEHLNSICRSDDQGHGVHERRISVLAGLHTLGFTNRRSFNAETDTTRQDTVTGHITLSDVPVQ